MWKRKRMLCCGGGGGRDNPETTVFPALESTLLIESGLDSGTPLNSLSSYVTSGMNGVKRIIYDGTYWNNDFFTTHYENTTAAILVTTYQSGDTFTTLFPIVLPRQVLASTSTSFLKKQQSIAYALNLLFSKAGYIVHSTPAGSYPYQYLALAINDFLPILQTATLPPLLWQVIPQTGQLALVVNPNYVNADPTYQIAFSVITMPSMYQGNQATFSGNVQITDPGAGWFADGGYVFGYGTLNNDTHLFDDSFARNPSYASVLKTLDLGDKIAMTLANWQAMVTSLGLSYVISCGERTVGCIPSKYYKIQSSALARIQRRNIVTNIQGGEFSETIGIVYYTSSSSNQYQDGYSSAPAIHFDPAFNGNNLVDIEWKDEWGNSMQPFPAYAPGPMSFFENTNDVPTYPPAAYQSLDPFNATNGPNYDCLFPYYKINQNMIVFPASGSGYQLPITWVYSSKYSSSISHFIRLIGS